MVTYIILHKGSVWFVLHQKVHVTLYVTKNEKEITVEVLFDTAELVHLLCHRTVVHDVDINQTRISNGCLID